MPPRGPESSGWKGLWLLHQQREGNGMRRDSGGREADPGKGELSLEEGTWKEQTQGRHPPGEAGPWIQLSEMSQEPIKREIFTVQREEWITEREPSGGGQERWVSLKMGKESVEVINPFFTVKSSQRSHLGEPINLLFFSLGV